MIKDLKEIQEHSYTWAQGFAFGDKQRAEGPRQLDWSKIRQIIDSNDFDRIDVGLAEDWACTKATVVIKGQRVILENVEAGFYGASRWATPAVKVYKDGKGTLYECWTEAINEGSEFPEWLKSTHRQINFFSDEYDELMEGTHDIQ